MSQPGSEPGPDGILVHEGMTHVRTVSVVRGLNISLWERVFHVVLFWYSIQHVHENYNKNPSPREWRGGNQRLVIAIPTVVEILLVHNLDHGVGGYPLHGIPFLVEFVPNRVDRIDESHISAGA